eukprot:CAMPEP_0201564800 /NCGR_PEP_ID=MMETSP0190_2-20130828/3383_1 /ASSEMBLY_ACC=CAM_ASM_000263 /TAXON_ID=37353 /ORGANISM="Rosalina sp." /LENGTH=34 /DNA_ID= /DNA_START= /DNA_END= /DNA_ORIENTATION=
MIQELVCSEIVVLMDMSHLNGQQEKLIELMVKLL